VAAQPASGRYPEPGQEPAASSVLTDSTLPAACMCGTPDHLAGYAGPRAQEGPSVASDDQAHEYGVAEEDEDEGTREHIEFRIRPFSRRFPGLAPAERHRVSPAQLDDVLGSLPAARIGLVPAGRPADVLPLIGWNGAVNGFATPLPIAAVLRSWEDRFGARLLEVGFDAIRLLAGRPPRTVEHAQRVAAEHLVVSDQCAVSDITASLMETPIWEFWWD